jgi:hypothetical protein
MDFDENYIVDKIKNLHNNQYIFNKMENFIEPDKTFTMHPKEIFMFEMMNKDPLDDMTVEYIYNNRGFRSDNFTRDHNKKHVVFSGCSEGEGIASPLDTMWNKKIYDFLNIDGTYDGFFNVAIDNFGFHKIVFNLINYINEYGKPDEIFILFPDTCRLNKWDTNESNYSQIWANPDDLIDLKDQEKFMNAIIDFIPFMKLFEEYCSSNNIKLIWSTWSYKESKVYSLLGTFKNYFEMDYSIDSNVSKDKQIRRDGHQGEYYHDVWSQNFIREITNGRN